MHIFMLILGVVAVIAGIVLLLRGRGGETSKVGFGAFVGGLLLIWISYNNLF